MKLNNKNPIVEVSTLIIPQVVNGDGDIVISGVKRLVELGELLVITDVLTKLEQQVIGIM